MNSEFKNYFFNNSWKLSTLKNFKNNQIISYKPLKTIQNKLIEFFYCHPYLSDILLGIGLGVFIIGISACAMMTWGVSLFPTVIMTSTIVGGSLGTAAGFAIVCGSVLFTCGLLATGWGFITNKFLLSKNNHPGFKTFQSSEKLTTANAINKSVSTSIPKTVIKEIIEDETITVTRSSLEKILISKPPIENPYQQTYFIGSERVLEYLSKINPDENEEEEAPRIKLSSSRRYVYNKKDIEDVIAFLHKNIEFFSAPFINPVQFNEWAKDNEQLKIIISKKLLLIFNRFAHMSESAVMRQVTNTPPFLGYQEALVGTSNLNNLVNPTEFTGLINNNKEPMRLFLRKEARLIEEFLIMKHSSEANEIIYKWYQDHHLHQLESVPIAFRL